MSNKRECGLFIACGFQGVGKSYTTNKEMISYLKGDASIGRKPQPVAILDSNNENQQIKAINYDVDEEDERKRTKCIRDMIGNPVPFRIIPFKKNKTGMLSSDLQRACVDLCNNFRVGLLILEDFNKYIKRGQEDYIIDKLIALRHSSVDCMIHLQSLSKVTPTLWENLRFLRFHKISEDIHRIKNRLPNYELMQIAQYIVDNRYKIGQERFYLYVSCMQDKLLGIGFNEFSLAANTYLARNPTIAKRLLSDIDNNTGERKFSHIGEAKNYWIKEKSKIYLNS